MAGGSRRERSRSPNRGEVGRRRDRDNNFSHHNMNPNSMTRREPLLQHNDLAAQPGMNMVNPMMMQNMYPQSMQGNMMMGGMYNMMIGQNGMMTPTMMPTNNMEMMSTNNMEIMSSSGMANMDIVPQQSMDMANMGAQTLPAGTTTSMDMSMMGGMLSNMGNALIGMYPNVAAENVTPTQEKKEMVFKYCTLTPPPPGTPQPACRPKPLGCRTIFVGGLPDKTRESTVREVFESFGRIMTLRLSKKNFCHIRFDREECVDAAMTITGYNMKIIPKDDKDKDVEENPRAYTGWIHVDYAMSRDDQNDFERKQRDAMRLQQHQMDQMSVQQRIINYRRSPSPLRVVPFSSAAISQLAEKIKTEDMFQTSLPTLITWLERGECSKKNSNQFYSMIQATNSHIRRLFNEKMQAEEELQEFKDKVKARIEKVIDQLEQVGKVFVAATHQRVWDHFTKPQRKNIETWQRMTQEFSTLREEFQEKFDNEDTEFNGNKVQEYGSGQDELIQLKRENESLQFQLEASRNEVDVIKMDTQKEMEKFKAQYIARQALQNSMAAAAGAGASVGQPGATVGAAGAAVGEPAGATNTIAAPIKLAADELEPTVEAGCGEARLIGVMATFLHVHPQGASLDYIVSYVRAMFPQTSQTKVHHVLQKHTEAFIKKTSGVGANIESKWFFAAFNDTKMET